MTQSETKELQSGLETCHTAGQMLMFIIERYNLDIKLGIATKAIFIQGLIQAARMLKLTKK